MVKANVTYRFGHSVEIENSQLLYGNFLEGYAQTYSERLNKIKNK